MFKDPRKLAAACAAVGAIGLAAGCGSDSSSDGSTSSSSSGSAKSATADALGTPKKATGTPYVFGMINDEAGQVTFPEARQGGEAAAKYINDYLGGINGHPIKIESCIGDASPATGARCANQLLAKKPMAIIGAADIGEVAALPIYGKAGIPYVGGIAFTPVAQNAPNAAVFTSVSLGDNAAAAYSAVKNDGVKKATVLYTNNSQGKISGLGVIPPVLKGAGATDVKTVGVPPATPDPSAQAAAAVQGNPDLIYVDLPNGCGNMLKALKSVGYTGKLMGIDTCTDPKVIESAAGGADGLKYASPFVLQSSDDKNAKIFTAAMQKYAPDAAIDSISTTTFAGVMNLQAQLSKLSGTPTSKKIIAAFKSAKDAPNFLGHPYTCDGNQIAGASAICDDHYLINQIEGGKPTQASATDWVTSKGVFKGLSAK